MSLQPDLSPYLPTYDPFSQMYPRPQPPGNTPEGLGLVFYVTNKGSHLLHSLHTPQGQTKRTWHTHQKLNKDPLNRKHLTF